MPILKLVEPIDDEDDPFVQRVQLGQVKQDPSLERVQHLCAPTAARVKRASRQSRRTREPSARLGVVATVRQVRQRHAELQLRLAHKPAHPHASACGSGRCRGRCPRCAADRLRACEAFAHGTWRWRWIRSSASRPRPRGGACGAPPTCGKSLKSPSACSTTQSGKPFSVLHPHSAAPLAGHARKAEGATSTRARSSFRFRSLPQAQAESLQGDPTESCSWPAEPTAWIRSARDTASSLWRRAERTAGTR